LKVRRSLSTLARKIICNRIVYRFYEEILWNQIKDGKKPEHIGVILDGNRRWANKRRMPSFFGHRVGADRVDELLRWCIDLGINTVTLYAFSTENFRRPQIEVDEIMELLNEKLQTVKNNRDIQRNKVCVRFIGRIHLLPERTQKLIREVEEATKSFDKYYLNIAVAYGGRAEIIDAVKNIAKEVKGGSLAPEDINESIVEDHLYTSHLPKSEPDLIIRTSGEERLSGFLLWQAAYSELCFIDVYWPDFRRIDLLRAIRTYQQRERRYGA
jgi:tritrans,polycis-undecaprenyl-diphosphate synthase [geranylgeranyl-diphosphate specific]